MQPDIPWNVAGIPPEAREAARAAARREGLSVGEWLTRHILKSLTEVADSSAWTGAAPADTAAESAQPNALAPPNTESLLGRMAQTEAEASSAYRKIEDQLRILARRVDATERTQSENSKVVSLAATEINSASREQAEAFDQLGQHVAGLLDRLNRLERASATDGVRDAVKGLHSGLARLTDQISETNNQSASQYAALVRNLESVTNRLNDARSEAGNAQRATTTRLHDFDERIRAVEGNLQASIEKLAADAARLNDSRLEANSTNRSLISRLQTVEERVRANEGAALVTVQKIDRAMTELETARNAQRTEQSESHRQAQLITQLSDALDKLTSRLSAGEAQTSGALARIEEQLDGMDSGGGDPSLDRRLQSIEHSVSDLSGRLDSTARSVADAARAGEDHHRALSARLDVAEQHQRDLSEEFSDARPVASKSPAPLLAPQVTSFAAENHPLAIEHPPVAPATVAAAPPPFLAAVAGTDEPLTLDTPLVLDKPADPDPLADIRPQLGSASGTLFGGGRHSARPATGTDTLGLRAGLKGFGFDASTIEKPPEKSGPAQFLLVAGIAVIAVGAVIAGVLLSRGLVGSTATEAISTPPQTMAPGAFPGRPAHPGKPAPQTANTAAPATRESLSAEPANATNHLASTIHGGTQPTDLSPPTPPTDATKSVALLNHLTTLAAAGNQKAELVLGLKYLDGDGTTINEAEAAKWLERAAAKGEAIAAYRLGTLYERGHGVPADPAKAVRWYGMAANLGNRKAMHNLAVAYAEGSGTAKNLTLAAQWFSKAAALGLGDSQFNLAVLYERGMGVQQSLMDAYKWYAIAAAQGDSESKARLDVIATQLSPDERAAAQRAAGDFHPLALDRNANVPPDPSIIG